MTLQSTSLSSCGFYCLEMEDLERRLKKLTEQTGYTLVQRNGQRIFGGPPPGWTSQQGPDRGTEVYCYKLPRLIFTHFIHLPLFFQILLLVETVTRMS